MYPVLQALIAILALYSALKLQEELRLFVPLGLLVSMFIIGRMDQRKAEKEKARKNFLKAEVSKLWEKETPAAKDQNFFTIESLLWPKSELLLIDTVHFIFKDFGFQISGGIKYHSIDRIVRIPEGQGILGLEILKSEKEVRLDHPKIGRALQFEKEKKEKEKTLIIASTHSRLSLSEMGQANHISKDLEDILTHHHISFMTTYHLYQLWQKAKRGKVDISEVFQKVCSHRGGVLSAKEI